MVEESLSQKEKRILFNLIDNFFEVKDLMRESDYKNFKRIAHMQVFS